MKITKMLWSALKALPCGAALSLGLGGLASAGTEPGRVWTHSTLSGTNFAQRASLGDRGGQVFTLIPGIGGKVRLISGATVQGGETVWEAALGYQVLYGMVSSADQTSRHGVVSVERASSTGTETVWVRFFDGNSAIPRFSQAIQQVPQMQMPVGVHLSDDGSRGVAWWYDAPNMKVRIRTYDLASNVALSSLEMNSFGVPMTSHVDRNMNTLFVTGGAIDCAVDLATGASLMNYNAEGTTTTANSLARDTGKRYAGMRVLPTNPASSLLVVYHEWGIPQATYPMGIWYTQVFGGDRIGSSCALSPSGNLLAVGTNSSTLSGQLAVELYDLSQSTRPLIQRVTIPNSAPAIGFSTMTFSGEDTLACTSYPTNTQAEVRTFRKINNQWVIDYEAESSVNAVWAAVSQQGRICVATVGSPSSGGAFVAQLSLHDGLARNLELRSVPYANTSADLRLYASPGSRAQLLQSTYLSPNPITFNNIGTLYLGSSGLVRVPVGIVPSTGFIDLQLPLPSQPGQTRYLQSFATNPRQLGSSALQVTTVP
jgi:hypothetical protein